MQEKFEGRLDAQMAALEIAPRIGAVQVVESNGKYFLETPPDMNMIRTWEKVIALYQNGKLVESGK